MSVAGLAARGRRYRFVDLLGALGMQDTPRSACISVGQSRSSGQHNVHYFQSKVVEHAYETNVVEEVS